MRYSDIDQDSASWHELLNDKHRAERHFETLAAQVERDHDEEHAGSLRWCSSGACRVVADWLKR